MKRIIPIVMTTIASCNPGLPKMQAANYIANTPPPGVNNADLVSFDFEAKTLANSKKTIEINATLSNENLDTVYFLTSTCDGLQYSLKYDTTNFYLTPFLHCNVSYPMIEKIPPKGKLNFKAYFSYNKTPTTIKLGFDFYKINSSFDLTTIKLHEIHYRPGDAKNLIWANTKSFE